MCGAEGWGLRGWGGAGGEWRGLVGLSSGRGEGEARADSPEWVCSCHSKGENLNERVGQAQL